MRPAAHLPFFASSKKGRPKKDDPTVRVPSLRYGQPAMLGTARRAPVIRAIAALGPQRRGRFAPRSARPSAAMARIAGALLAVPRSAGRGAGMRVAARMHRCLICRSCLNGARQRAVSSAARPATEHRRLPRSAAKGTRTVGSSFFGLPFFDEAKKGRCAAGRISRPATSKR